MPSPRDGILSSHNWDDVKNEFSPGWTESDEMKPFWRPTSPGRKYRLTPSRIASLFWPKRSPSPEKLRPTAYLDGLRGFAAFLVYWHHHELWVHDMTGQNPIFENGFGYDGNYHFVTLPVVRNFFSGGHYAVSTFFVISGYVLSTKPLALIEAGEHIQLGDNLASALFRRWFRLFLPLIITISLYATTWHLFGIWVRGATQQGTWLDEMWSFYLEFKNFSFVFKEGGNPWLSYSFHLWSIPIEFKGSIVIYTSLMALSRCSRAYRLCCELGLIYYFMYITDGWYCAMFVAGMLLCDLDLLARTDKLPRLLARLGSVKIFVWYHLLALSLFLGGVPSENREIDQLAKSRGWYYLSYLKPQAVFDYKWFYLFWASSSLVAIVPRIGWLRRFFETRFCQYLGRISFGLYLIHGPVLWTLGDRLYMATGWHTQDHMEHIPHWADKLSLSRSGPIGLEVSFLLPHIILLPLTLLMAEAITRFIDTPSVKFAAWLYKKTLPISPMRQSKA